MLPVIFSIAAESLMPEERDFFTNIKPLGFILFGRNLSGGADIIRKLSDDLKSCSGDETLVMVDVEGGRVNRLAHIEYFPSARYFGDLMYRKSKNDVLSAMKANVKSMANLLKSCGFNCVCAPCTDLYYPNLTAPVIGERSFSDKVEVVVELAKITTETFGEMGIKTMIKHLPGHGCVEQDSHETLPTIPSEFSLKDLRQKDFSILSQLAGLSTYAMLSHVLYPCLDPDHPSSQSKKVIDYIRNELGFKDVKLITDDIRMGALSGNFSEKAESCFSAGCDIVMYCGSVIEEMKAVVEGYERYLLRN